MAKRLYEYCTEAVNQYFENQISLLGLFTLKELRDPEFDLSKIVRFAYLAVLYSEEDV